MYTITSFAQIDWKVVLKWGRRTTHTLNSFLHPFSTFQKKTKGD